MELTKEKRSAKSIPSFANKLGMKKLIALSAYKSLVVLKKCLKYGHARKYFRSPGATAETIAFLTPFYPLYVAPTKDSRYATSCALTMPPVSSVVSIRSAEDTRQRSTPQKKKKGKEKRKRRYDCTIINNRSSFPSKDMFAFYYFACTTRFSGIESDLMNFPGAERNEEGR